QDLRFGIARVYAFGNLTRTVAFYDRVTEADRETISTWAKTRGFEAMDREKFVLSVFLPYALDMRAVVVGFNLPFDLSRLAVDFAPKRNVRATEAWTLRLLLKDHPKFAFAPVSAFSTLTLGSRLSGLQARKASSANTEAPSLTSRR
ncbi:hypothetical protein B1B_12116, partial [mine drainage metagenome]